MFDFSFGEVGLIAVVALVVLGPERLPKVARTAGALLRRARTSWQSVKDDIERELEAENLKQSLDEARKAAADLRNDIRTATDEIGSSTQSVANEMASVATSAAPPATTTATPPPPATPSATIADDGASAKLPDPGR
jgi:sec-independent protein translocase protein TatB